MNLAIFDVDGTLTQTSAVDEICFVRAVTLCFGIATVNTDWTSYEHATDAAVIDALCRQNLGRSPRADEIAAVKKCFRDLLTKAHGESPESFAAVPGAAAVLNRLNGSRTWRTAIATGGWFPSATLKLETAGLSVRHIPAAFAEDGPSREAIVQMAIARACSEYGEPCFDRVVSVGDAVWDVLTAKRLELPFIGIARGVRADTLRSAGARQVLEDFQDEDEFDRQLDAAAPPV